MKKLLLLYSLMVGFLLFTPLLFAQDGRDLPIEPDVVGDLPPIGEEEYFPHPRDEYYGEIERIRELALQEYAGEIADSIVLQLEQQKIWQELLAEFLETVRVAEGFYPEPRDITVPAKEDVVAFVFQTVESLGGLAAPEALVGIIVDDVAGTLYSTLVNLPFNDAQREVLYLPRLEYLNEEQVSLNVLHYIKNHTVNEYNAYQYFPMPHEIPVILDFGDGIGDGVDLDHSRTESERRVNTKPAVQR